MRLLAMFVMMLFIGGCDKDAMLQKFSSPEIQAEAQGYIAKLRSGDIAAVESAMDPSLQDSELRPALVRMASLIPAGDPTSVKLVGAHKSIDNGETTVNSTYQYQFGSKWMLINVAVRESDPARKIIGFNVVPQPASLDEQHGFSLAGKGATHYAFLAATVAAVLVTLTALIKCIRTRMPGRKWPWVLFILFGFGKFALNWSTGAIGFVPLSVQFLSASAMAGIYEPWFVAFSIPVGALVFLYKYRARPELPVAADPA